MDEERKKRKDEPAFNLLMTDIVGDLLSQADNPGRASEILSRELRGIVGARCIAAFECLEGRGYGKGHALLSVCPERHRDLATRPEIEGILSLSHGWTGPRFFSPESEGPEGELARALGVGLSLGLPLEYGSMRLGSILFLDFLDSSNLDSVLLELKRLASILALVIRNAQLYTGLERAVELKTQELRERTRELETTLRERDILLKEIHHRVKNNLQVITSFLYLKEMRLPEGEAKSALLESRHRVYAMALVHESLYASPDLQVVEMSRYLPDLVDRIVSIAAPGMRRRYDIQSLSLDLDEALPCGLAVNELVVNSLRHGLAQKTDGILSLRLERREDCAILELSDNGPGYPPDFSPHTARGLGFSILSGLAEQLKGSLSIIPGAGAKTRLTFPLGRTKL